MEKLWVLAGWVLVVALLLYMGCWGLSFLQRIMMWKSLKKVARAMTLRPLYGPDVRVEDFEANLRRLPRNSPEAVGYTMFWVVRVISRGEQPRKVDVKRLRTAGELMRTDEEGRALFPGAFYEMAGLTRRRAFFRKNLTLAGYKDYRVEVAKILGGALAQRGLLPRDAAFLQRIRCLSEEKKRGDHYGGPGFPYPDVRYRSAEFLEGEHLELFFDESFQLVVFQKSWEDAESAWHVEVVWERSGAGQPGLYSER